MTVHTVVVDAIAAGLLAAGALLLLVALADRAGRRLWAVQP